MSDTPRVPDLWWSAITRRVLWLAEENGWCSTDLIIRDFDETLPADAVKLGDVEAARAEIDSLRVEIRQTNHAAATILDQAHAAEAKLGELRADIRAVLDAEYPDVPGSRAEERRLRLIRAILDCE